MKVRFFAAARSELRQAAVFYEARQQGLGRRFRAEIAQVCRVVAREPMLWRERAAGYRRVNCRIFPYYVAYIVEEGVIYVVAVAHAHREPDYWAGRLES